MGKQPDAYLEIALSALQKTVRYVGNLSLQEYLESDLCRSAVERELEIAGDALGQLRRQYPDVFANIPEGSEVVAFRNVLAHGYASLNHRIVFAAATAKAPPLIRALELLLDEFPSG